MEGPSAKGKSDVRKGERRIVIGRAGVFARPEEEEETNADHICHGGSVRRRSAGRVGAVQEVCNECNSDWSDAPRGRVLFLPGT